MNFILSIFREIWLVTVAMAPYLLFGFLMAGILSELVSKTFVRRHLGGRHWMQSVKAALVGVPMPICSCGVIPLAASLREQGASRGATASFLASTPQTGVDSLMVTYALLGLPFAIFRAVVAFASGIICGTAVEAVTTKAESSAGFRAAPGTEPADGTWLGKLRRMLAYGFISLPRNISKPMVFGIILSGIISALVPENYFADKMDSFWMAMVLMMAIGTPLYVCSSASVPIALAFITAGIPPGAALVFLIMGPATNAAALTTLWKLIGKKQLAVFMAALATTAMGAGLLMNQFAMTVSTSAYACHSSEGTGFLQLAATVLLVLVLAYGMGSSYRRN